MATGRVPTSAVVLTALALVAAACGGDSSSITPLPTSTTSFTTTTSSTSTTTTGIPATGGDRIARVENGLLSPVTDGAFSVEEMMEFHSVPGVSVAVITDFQIEWAKGYGVREAGRPGAVTPDTLFQTASVGKLITALTALAFTERGLIDLDIDVNEYLTSWRLPNSEFTTTEDVTLRRLLSHTGGTTVGGYVGYPLGDPLPTLQQTLDGEPPANGPPIRVDTLPGVEVRYSNGGYMIIQQLLEDVTGRPFDEIVEETVFEPLEMASTFYAAPLPDDLHTGAATAHNQLGLVGPTGKWHDLTEFGAGGGLWSTSSDLARLVIEIMRSAAGDSNRILSTEMTQLMLAPAADVAGADGTAIGLGPAVSNEATDPWFYAGGSSVPGYRTVVVGFPEEGMGAVIMTNAQNGDRLYGEFLVSLATEYRWPTAP
jgi:CubicO group peptidase (beta-lactamase class C family)